MLSGPAALKDGMTDADDFRDNYDFSRCLLLSTVMAARAMTRRYDERLRPFGVSVAQFTVLGAVRKSAGETMTAIAERIAMDRTTLSRNLDLLVRKGLVREERAPRGNGRVCHLTPEGDALLDAIIPVWRQAQAELRELVKDHDTDAYLTTLERLTRG